MKLFTEITPAAINEGSFENEAGEKVEYFQVQFMDKVSKKLGDEYIEVEDVATVGIRKELIEKVQVGKKLKAEIRVTVSNPKNGFPKAKFSIIDIVSA